ncbi:MAG: alkaline phosphatase D family protein [Bacteroidota bacterium]
MKFAFWGCLLGSALFLSACTSDSTAGKTAMVSTASTSLPDRPEFAQLDSSNVLGTIAFGSCNHEYDQQPMWDFILQENPDLWIWLGDNIYGDSEDMSVLQAKYDQQLDNPDYQTLYRQVPIIGTWDDHDYGVNDGGKEFPQREASAELMMNFLNVPADAPQRQRPGTYSRYTLGTDSQLVKIILLDARYFRDELVQKGRGYGANATGDILGEAQWTWLAEELANSTAQVNIIGSGIQMIPEQHRFEKWANFPTARKRLLELIVSSKIANPILISGDRHIGEISKLDIQGDDSPIYEITSSGLTHSYEKAKGEKNRYRISELIGEKNFGLLHLDWSGDQVQIKTQLKGLENKLHDEVAIQ